MDFTEDPRFQRALKRLPRPIGISFYVIKGLMESVFSLGMNGIGPLLMLVGHTIIVGLVYVYFTVPVVPDYVPNYIYVPWTMFGLWLVFNIFFNWHMCAFISPGLPPKSAPNSPYKICQKCDRMKPPRTHHCSACGVCILAMDHHCPWMNNCIGFYNYKYFFLMLFYTFSGLVFNLATCAYFYPIYSYVMPSFMVSGDVSRRTVRSIIPKGVLVSVMLSISVGIAVSFLLFWHCYLAGTGQSTIEFYQYRLNQIGKAKRFNDYDLGRRKNFEMIFGKSKYPLGWTLPSLQPPIGNGMTWPTVKTAYKDFV